MNTTTRKMGTARRSSLLAFSTAFFRISTMFFLLMLLSHVKAQNNFAEVTTLLQIKAESSADSSGIAIGYWGTWKENSTNPCSWWGIICTSNNTVEQLSLSGWHVTHLPNFTLLSDLRDLRVLDLSFNDFRNESDENLAVRIPEAVGSLAALTKLDLRFNSFSGPIPASISACHNLRYINFEGCSLSVIPDLSALTGLQYLYLPTNQFSGQFPVSVTKLTSLQVIKLSSNMFNGTIPSIPGLSNLIEIMLDNNSFTGFVEPVFPGATNLEHLDVHMNQLQGSIPPSLTKLLNLRDLDLSINNLSGTIPTDFSLNMSTAISFNLFQNSLTGGIPENLLQPTPDAQSLPILKLSSNLLTGPIPFDATKQYHYKTLDLANNSLSGSIPSICNNGSSSISQFWIHANQLEGDIVDFLAQCYTCIGDLQMANNSFTGDLSRIVANLSLTTISELSTSKRMLQTVDLSNNNLQMSVSERVSDPLRAVLQYFVINSSIAQFRMPGNNFSGVSLPSYFDWPLSSLQILDLSNNSLSGKISEEAFNSTWMPALQYLNFSNNDLTGPIPQAVVLLPKLLVLDVVNNSLSGALPTDIPTQLNPNYFSGNPGLCGGPAGGPVKACSHPKGSGVKWWVLLTVIGGCSAIALTSCLVLTWRWRKYHILHQQDADLIKTLLERESASLMSLRELKRATSNFADKAQIGKGGFGTVYSGKLNDGTVVAIKRSRCEGFEKDKNQFLNEVRILSQVSHRHLVKLLGCCMENKTALLVFEFVSNGTLQEHLQGNFGSKRLSWQQRLSIAIQTADALNYLHTAASFPIYHRDVKSANILLDSELNAKVADFGISRLAPAQEATHVSTIAIQGTVGYMDPEYYASYQLTDKSDVYSFGVVLLELLSAKPAVDFLRGGEETSLVHFANLQMERGEMRKLLDVSIMETYNDKVGYGRQSILNVGRLAMKCLSVRSKARPSMREVWKELQNIWLELQGSSKELTPLNTDDAVAAEKFKRFQHDHIVLLSESFSGDSSSFTLPTDSSIQLSQLSSPHSGTFSK